MIAAIKSNTCMGVYDFREKRDLFHGVVKPLVESLTGLVYVDALDFFEASTIKMDLIAEMIRGARLLIVDVSEKNPNVFLEYGIGYAWNKPMILLCSEKAWDEKWKGKEPFDIKGRELLIYKSDNDLKVKLGLFIWDSLYETEKRTVAWLKRKEIEFRDEDEPKTAQIRSPFELEFLGEGRQVIWSSEPGHSNFILGYTFKIKEYRSNTTTGKPDVRLHLAASPGGYPRVTCIFPWEHGPFQCHINIYYNHERHERLQQIKVADSSSSIEKIKGKEYKCFLSFCWPNMVFESTFFKIIDRVLVPKKELISKGFPAYNDLYVGFQSGSYVVIKDINMKEVLLH